MNIVHEKDGKWYFWDETLSEEYGPFFTIKEATEAFKST